MPESTLSSAERQGVSTVSISFQDGLDVTLVVTGEQLSSANKRNLKNSVIIWKVKVNEITNIIYQFKNK